MIKSELLQVMNQVSENIFILDKEMTIVWFNSYANNLIEKCSNSLNIKYKNELIGRKLDIFIGEKQTELIKHRKVEDFPLEYGIEMGESDSCNIIINEYDVDNYFNGYIVTVKDVSFFQKRFIDIQEALDKSSIVVMVDRRGVITYVNDKFCQITQYDKRELIGKEYRTLNMDNYPDQFHEEIIDTIKQGEVWRGELKQKAKDGSPFWVATTIVPLVEENKPFQFITIQQDITSRKKGEELLLRSEKLSVLGELAAGLAHEIRNPLTSIKGFTQLDSFQSPFKGIMLEEIDRIAVIVNEFMMLAKPHEVTYTPKDIQSIIEYVIKFLEPESNLKNVRFHLICSTDKTNVNCEENQLKQVFINIIKNGMESMPEGGTVIISISEDDNRLQIEISDEGVGLTEVEIDKLGVPFYSLKKKGTGLGLMMTFRIIENHGGKYHIKSEVNRGTTFYMSFPLYSEQKVHK